MAESVQERVLRVIAVKQRIPLETVTPDSTFEQLNIDSLDRLNLLFELEGEFDIQIDDEQAKQVTSIRQMIEGIEHLVSAKDNPGQAAAQHNPHQAANSNPAEAAAKSSAEAAQMPSAEVAMPPQEKPSTQAATNGPESPDGSGQNAKEQVPAVS